MLQIGNTAVVSDTTEKRGCYCGRNYIIYTSCIDNNYIHKEITATSAKVTVNKNNQTYAETADAVSICVYYSTKNFPGQYIFKKKVF